MPDEPSIWARVFEFAEAILPYWWIVLTSGIGPAMIIAWANKNQERFRVLKIIAKPHARPWIILVIFGLGFAYASFSAFDDVNSRLRTKSNELVRAQNRGSVEQQQAIDQLKTDLADARKQIDALIHPPADVDAIIQSGITVGKAFGARRSPNDATMFQFEEITHAGRFNAQIPFQYHDVTLQMIQFGSDVRLDAARAEDGRIIRSLVARAVQ
jgi:hypothetical protein